MKDDRVGLLGRHLKSWFTGRPVAGAAPGAVTATVVLEDAAHLPALEEAGVLGARSVVLVPAGAGQAAAVAATVAGYEGSFGDPSSDISVEDTIFVQTQDYATSPYVTLVGSTLVRIVGDVDLEAFLADADTAHAEGRVPEFVVSPAVQIADVTALGAPAAGDGPRTRLHVAASGAVSTSPGGLPLGAVGDPLDRLEAEWRGVNDAAAHPCAVALGGVLTESLRTAALAQRPWLGRYLDALDLQRELAAMGVPEVRVSGFGGRLVPALAELPGADDPTPQQGRGEAVPLIAWTPEAAYLRAPGSGRLFTLNRRVAAIAEVLLTLGPTDAAAAYATPESLARVAALLDRHGVARPGLVVGAAQ